MNAPDFVGPLAPGQVDPGFVGPLAPGQVYADQTPGSEAGSAVTATGWLAIAGVLVAAFFLLRKR